jgi:hypothetical protein
MTRRARSTAPPPPPPPPGPPPVGAATALPGAVRWQPFQAFLGPARRRTDHPLVVGTIIICLGLSTAFLMLQLVAVIWAGTQVANLMAQQLDDRAASKAMRTSIIRSTEAQARIIARICYNTARDEKDRGECAALIPPVSDLDPAPSSSLPDPPKRKRFGGP